MSLDYRYYDQYNRIIDIVEDAKNVAHSVIVHECKGFISYGTVRKRVNELVEADVLAKSSGKVALYSLFDFGAWFDLGEQRLEEEVKEEEGEEAAKNSVVAEDINWNEEDAELRLRVLQVMEDERDQKWFTFGYLNNICGLGSLDQTEDVLDGMVEAGELARDWHDEHTHIACYGYSYRLATDTRWQRDQNAPEKPVEAVSETVAASVVPEADEAPLVAPVAVSAPVVATMVANVPEEPVKPSVPVKTPLQWIANTEGITRQLFGKPVLLFVPFAKGNTTDDVNLHARALNQNFQLTVGSGGYWRGFDSVDEAMLVKLKLEGSSDFPYPISLVERPPVTIESIIANAVAEAVKLTKRQADTSHAATIAALTEERDTALIERDAFWNRANAAESSLDTIRQAMQTVEAL